jgi:hypothetical protein
MKSKQQLLISWYLQRIKKTVKRRSGKQRIAATNSNKRTDLDTKTRQIAFIEAILICLCHTRDRSLWMHPRSFTWIEMVEHTYNDELWYANFRVTKETFRFLLDAIGEEIYHPDTVMRSSISIRRRLALTLYFLASTAEYRTIANLFGVSRSFVCVCVKDVCRAITNCLSKVISFPQGDQLLHVIHGYERKWGFPMCAGAIDGTHIPILAPTESHAEYVNRKGYHSIIMQAVVDCDYLFRDVVIGWPGSVHDARVFSNSAIFTKGNDQKLFPRELTKEINGEEIPPLILADPAYPLLPWLLKGYPRNNAAQRREKVFNYRLSRARMTVENTFGRWKGRFTRFSKRVDMGVSALVSVTHASCILHNLCELQKNDFLPLWRENEFEDIAVAPVDDNVLSDAQSIRDALADLFNAQ